MRIFQSVCVGVVILAGSACAWRSTVYPDTWTPPGLEKSFYSDKIIQDFSYAGYHRGDVGIPAVGGTVYDVTQAPYNADASGTNNATAGIQAAIDAAGAAGGGVVYLPAGTYWVAPPSGATQALLLNKSHVVLRGAGVGKTFILNTSTSMRSKSIIKVNSGSSWSTATSLATFTADAMGPTRSVTVNSVASIKAGDWILLHSDVTESWVNDHNEPAWSGSASSFPGFYYLRHVDSVNTASKKVYFDIPIRYSMKVRDNASVYKATAMLSEVGVEYLSIGNIQNNSGGYGEEDYNVSGTAAYNSHASYVITFQNARDSWVHKVETYKYSGNASGAHILSNGLLLLAAILRPMAGSGILSMSLCSLCRRIFSWGLLSVRMGHRR